METTAAAAAGRLRWWLADRLDRVALTPTSLLGVCLALGITASGWFTGGTRSADVNGAIALCCGYLAALGARRVAAAQSGSQAARIAAWPEQRTAAWPARRGAAGSVSGHRLAGGERAGWLAALATRLFDGVVYVGLAVGAIALGWGDQIWPLALSVLALVAVREMMLACTGGGLRADAEHDGIARRVIMAVATMPLGGRVLLIAVAAPIWGPRAALLGLLDWGIIAVGLGLGSANPARRRDKAEPAENEEPDPAWTRQQPSALSALLHADAPPPAEAPPPPAPPPPAPSAATPPTATPPTVAPPAATPPMTTPPVATPSAATPPVTTPPATTPPVTTPPDVSTPPVTVVPPVYTAATDPVATSTAAGAAQPSTAARSARSAATPAAGRQPISVLRMEINAPPAGLHGAGLHDAGLHDAGHDLADNARDTVPPWPFAFSDDSDDPEDAADTDGFAAIRPDAMDAAAYDPAAYDPAAYDPAAYDAGPLATTAHGAAADDAEDPEDAAGGHLTTPEDRRIAAARAVIMRSRDDGMVARWFGGVASGHLMPLPPALLALVAVATLAHLGLRDLPGLLILAPALIMLVAAPGASHRHDGRLDWLVPAVLLGAQVIYISALGFASGVPAPVTFGLCATLAVFCADLGAPGSPPLPGRNGHERGSWLGWDGRMLACGLGAAMGIAMFAYLALAVYLAVLVCWKITTGYSGFREGDCR